MRNAREWAKKKQEEFIATANGKLLDAECLDLALSTQSFILLLSDRPIHLEFKTLANELALDTNAFTTSSRRTSVGARTNRLFKVLLNRRLKKKPFRADRVSTTYYGDLQEIKG